MANPNTIPMIEPTNPTMTASTITIALT
jgi:hypothetical protein